MSQGGVWLVIVGGMLVTFLTRFSFIGILPAERLPPVFRSGLRYVAPAVLAAIIAPALLLPDGSLNLSLGNYQLLAGLAALAVAVRFRNLWLTIAVGLAVFWLLRTLGG
ncbi:MAG: AzlD domain-containing protein [Anaerolineales bacterium]|nr:AzlD domain-containing protein [Anaerolineales bacterium]